MSFYLYLFNICIFGMMKDRGLEFYLAPSLPQVATLKSRSELSAIPTLGPDLAVKVMDLEFSYKSQNVCILVFIAISSRPFDEIHLYLAWW